MSPEPVEDQIERARNAGVRGMIVVGVNLATSKRSIELASRHDGVHAAVGVHPNDAKDPPVDAIAELARDPLVVAIGETGIDRYRDFVPFALQEESFRAHIDLAKDLNKPLVIHSRDAHDDVIRILVDHGPPERLVMHCFSGNPEQAGELIALGAMLSFAGPVTFSNAHDLRAAAASIPLETMLVETDSPFLSPHPYRGRSNEPARVVLVGEAIARIRDVKPEFIAEVTSANAGRLFDIGE